MTLTPSGESIFIEPTAEELAQEAREAAYANARKQACSLCRGSGTRWRGEFYDCPRCDGRGWMPKRPKAGE